MLHRSNVYGADRRRLNMLLLGLIFWRLAQSMYAHKASDTALCRWDMWKLSGCLLTFGCLRLFFSLLLNVLNEGLSSLFWRWNILIMCLLQCSKCTNFRSSSTIAHKPIQKVDCMYGTDAVRNASTATAEKMSAFKVSQTKCSPVQAKKNEFEHVKEGEASSS